jgi:polyphenol oxidase
MILDDASNPSSDIGTNRIGAITSRALTRTGLVHAFFTRDGGVSPGVYATLNGGIGSNDDPAHVHENRRRMADHLRVADPILIPFQIHSADALVIDRPFAIDERPRCDGLVTTTRGLALGVTGADCGMILFADEEAEVIGAAHAGWRGALGGILEATLAAMESRGATRETITAVLGPTIGWRSYEVGAEFKTRFMAEDAGFARFFDEAARPGHFMFDLPGFIGLRLTRAGVGHFEDLALDTYADPQRFFSYRRKTHQSEPDYGRLVSAIALV